MSATPGRSSASPWGGPIALKSRSTRSGAGRASLSRRVRPKAGQTDVVTEPPWRWLAPTGSVTCTSRATRLRPCLSPSCPQFGVHARRAVGLPRAGVDGPHPLSSAASATAWADGGRCRQAWYPALDAPSSGEPRCNLSLVAPPWFDARVHEPEEPDGIVPWRALLAFPPGEHPADASRGRLNVCVQRPRLSRECRAPGGADEPRAAAGLRRRARHASRSAAARTAGGAASRRPSWRSAQATRQTYTFDRIACAEGSNSRARSAGSRPARTVTGADYRAVRLRWTCRRDPRGSCRCRMPHRWRLSHSPSCAPWRACSLRRSGACVPELMCSKRRSPPCVLRTKRCATRWRG